jgi:hypothetical protein
MSGTCRHHDEKIKVLLWKRHPKADQGIARFIRPLVAISARLAAANAKLTLGAAEAHRTQYPGGGADAAR